MGPQTLDPIYFLITDLAAPARVLKSVREQFKRLGPLKNGQNVKKAKSSKRLLSLYHFAPIKHWAVRIRDYCYEVNSEYDAQQKKTVFVLNNKVHFSDWETTNNQLNVSWEAIEVGATVQSDEVISQHAETVWNSRFRVKFKLLSQNCQNFAYCLHRLIAVDPNTVDDEVRRMWKRIPNRVTQFKTVFKRMAPMLARGLVIEGIELTLEGAAIIGLEVVGLSLLGPVGEIILVAAVLAPLFLAKSKDAKWLKDKVMKKKKKKRPADENIESQENMVIEQQMEQIIMEYVEQTKPTDSPPSYTFDQWKSPQETGVTEATQLRPQHEARYQGYNRNSIDRYAKLGFSVEHVVAVLREWKIDPSGGEEFTFSEADHQLMINSLLGQYGFDKVMSTAVFKIPRKPLPKNAVSDHWAELIDIKALVGDSKDMIAEPTVREDRNVLAH